MKIFLRIAVVSLGLLLLSACASTQKAAYGDAPPKDEEVVTDTVYVAMVDQIAKQRGTQVLWVNPPQKRVAREVASSR